MIKTVSVYAGTLQGSAAVQEQAVRMAHIFGAQLRMVLARPAAEEAKLKRVGLEDTSGDFEDPQVERMFQEARDSGLEVHRRYRAEARLAGLVAESRECDLLVAGMPTDRMVDDQSEVDPQYTEGLSLVRSAESSLLLVRLEPVSVQRLLVVYTGGLEGKSALRLAGHLSERAQAPLTVLTLQGVMAEAGVLAGAARQYLSAFTIPELTIVEDADNPESESRILLAVRDSQSNLLIMGGDGYSWLEHVLNAPPLEGAARTIPVSVLIAR